MDCLHYKMGLSVVVFEFLLINCPSQSEKKNFLLSNKAVISNTLTKIAKLALLVAYNTPLRETQGKNLVRIYTSQKIMVDKTNIYVLSKHNIHR